MYDRLGKSASRMAGNAETLSGVLGYSIGGVFRVVDPDDPRKFFVRYPNGNFVSAFHYNRVVQKPGMPVLTSTDNLGRAYIVGEDKSKSASFQPSTSSGSGIGYHTHVRGSGMEYITDSWMLKQLRVAPIAGTLGITVAAGSYIFGKTLHWYSGETLDLTAYVPAATGSLVWVIVALNPISGAAQVFSGSSYLGDPPADMTLIPNVPVYELGYIPLCAIWLQQGDSAIPSYRVENLVYRTGGAAWYLEDLFNVSDSGDYNSYVLTYESGYWIGKPPSGSGSGISGSTGAADNALIRANGTGGTTIQGSPVIMDDSGNTNFADAVIQRPTLKDYGETTDTVATSGSTETIDLELGNVKDLTLSANCTLTFSNPPASGITGSFTLILRQNGSGGWVTTWPASVKWSGGTPPTLTTSAGAVDVLTFFTVDGTIWYGFVAGLAMA